jgi:hypothetical protein
MSYVTIIAEDGEEKPVELTSFYVVMGILAVIGALVVRFA